MTTRFQAVRLLSTRLLLLALCLLFTSSARAQTTPRYSVKPAASDAWYYVAQSGNDSNTCRSQGDACASWQAAINLAAAAQPSHSGTGTVVILPGLYLTNSAVTQTANVNVFAYGAELRAGASFPINTTLYTIGSVASTQTTMLFGATLNCNSVAGCLALSGPNLNEQAGFADVTINHAMAGCLSVGTTSQNWTMGSLDCLMDTTAPSTSIPIVIKGTGTLLPGSGNYGHWTVGGTNTATLPEDIELFNVGGMSLSDIHMEAKATDGILLTGSAGIGTGLVTIKNVTGNSVLTNVVHEDSTSGNGNNVFLGILKNGATLALKDDVTGASLSSGFSAYTENPSASQLTLTSSGGGTILHQAPNTAATITVTDPVATTLTPVVGTCTMTTTTCTVTVVSGATHCIVTDNSASHITGGCAISGTTLTVTAASSNTDTWAVLWW